MPLLGGNFTKSQVLQCFKACYQSGKIKNQGFQKVSQSKNAWGNFWKTKSVLKQKRFEKYLKKLTNSAFFGFFQWPFWKVKVKFRGVSFFVKSKYFLKRFCFNRLLKNTMKKVVWNFILANQQILKIFGGGRFFFPYAQNTSIYSLES